MKIYYKVILVAVFIASFLSCSKKTEISSEISKVTTLCARQVGFTRVHVCIKVDTSTFLDFKEKGVCYSTLKNPTIADNKSSINYWSEYPTKMDYVITGLIPNTTYYIRPYVTDNNSITSYSEMLTIKTRSIDTATVYFQFNNEGGGWGYLHNGWFIDSKGNVMGYNFDITETYDNPNFKSLDSAGYISKDDLEYNFHLTDTIYKSVDPLTLSAKIALINNASTGAISNLPNGCWDCSTLNFYCYMWDNVLKKYKRIFIEQRGEQNAINTNSDAILLSSWLKSIESSICGCDLN